MSPVAKFIAYAVLYFAAGFGFVAIVCCAGLVIRYPGARRLFANMSGARRRRLAEIRHQRALRALDRAEQVLLDQLDNPDVRDRERREVNNQLFHVRVMRTYRS